MSRMFSLAIAIGLSAACGGNDFEPAEARNVFDESNALVHQLHIQAFALPTWPATRSMDCPGGGNVAMTTVFGADNKFEDLLHVFEGCSVDGLIFDGPLDYLNVTRCADSTFSYSIVGSIDVAGQGECPIEATETCGVPTGKTCGIAL